MLRFLHLSDLHFTTDHAGTQFDDDESIRAALLADLGQDSRSRFDAIVITGDIAYHGYEDEYKRARTWIEEVRVGTASTPESVFVVPGNHDVNQKRVGAGSSLWDLHQSIRRESNQQARRESLDKKLRDPFDFLTAMAEYRAFASFYQCPTTAGGLAWQQVLDSSERLDGWRVRLHGLNSALISDERDAKGNLLLGPQLRHLDGRGGFIDVVLCHHPHPWLLDGNDANDSFRNQAQIVLCGHEHDVRCYKEGGSLRLFAGAVHPNRREQPWQPCYHVLTVAVVSTTQAVLDVRVETRVWLPKDKRFGPLAQPDGSLFKQEEVHLPRWQRPTMPPFSSSEIDETPVSLVEDVPVTAPLNDEAFAAARRKLIVHFFRLGTLARVNIVVHAGVWAEEDDALDGQARWARIFERAQSVGKLGALWTAVAEQDETLAGQPNPFL